MTHFQKLDMRVTRDKLKFQPQRKEKKMNHLDPIFQSINKMLDHLAGLRLVGALLVLFSVLSCLVYEKTGNAQSMSNATIQIMLGAPLTLASQIKSEEGIFKEIRHGIIIASFLVAGLYSLVITFGDLAL